MQNIAGAVSVAFLTAGFFSCVHAATLATPPANPIRIYQAIQTKEMTVKATSANLRDQPADSGHLPAQLRACVGRHGFRGGRARRPGRHPQAQPLGRAA